MTSSPRPTVGPVPILLARARVKTGMAVAVALLMAGLCITAGALEAPAPAPAPASVATYAPCPVISTEGLAASLGNACESEDICETCPAALAAFIVPQLPEDFDPAELEDLEACVLPLVPDFAAAIPDLGILLTCPEFASAEALFDQQVATDDET